jgi:hypothetical protein
MPETSNLPDLILYKFIFNFEFLEDALLPEFKGSTIRGAFGWKLLKAVEGLYPVYEKIFETKGDENNPSFLKGVGEVPHPFILRPPLTKKRDFKQWELFSIGITLIGYSHNFLPFFIDAFSSMGKSGITKGRKKLKLLNVLTEDINGLQFIIFDGSSSKINNNYKAILLKDIITGINCNTDNIKLKFESPFLFRFESSDILEKNKNKITPNLLTARLEARYKTLAQLYCRSTTGVREIFCPDSSVKITRLDVGYYEMKRRPKELNGIQKFLGLTGSITLEGNLRSLLPLLYIGERINVGSKSSFGWGQYKLEIPG